MKPFILGLLFLFSCNYKTSRVGSEGPFKVSQALLQSISFNQLKTEVLRPKCISCHGNSGGVNLESYAAAYQHLDAIRRTTLEGKSMPKSPYPPLTRRELELVTAWVEAGGPDRPMGGGEGPSDGEIALEPNFPSIKKNIIDMKCLSCHQVGGTAARIPMDSRQVILDSPLDLVIPGDPDESGITIVIEPGARKFMPPEDSGISPVTEEERNVIRKWIEDGAL